MVIAIIKAQVHPNKWEAIKKAFKSEIGALKLFPIAEIFLIQSKADPTFWQILSIWYSLDDLKDILPQHHLAHRHQEQSHEQPS